MNNRENIPIILLVNYGVENNVDPDYPQDDIYIIVCPECGLYSSENYYITDYVELQDKNTVDVGMIAGYCCSIMILDPYIKPTKIDIDHVIRKYSINKLIQDRAEDIMWAQEKGIECELTIPRIYKEYPVELRDIFYKEASKYSYLEYEASFILEVVDIKMSYFIADKKASTSDMEILFGMKYDYSNVTDQHIQIMKRLGMKYIGYMKPPKIITENIPCIKKYKDDEFSDKKFNLSVRVDSFNLLKPKIPYPKGIEFSGGGEPMLMKCLSLNSGTIFNYISWDD